MKLQFNISRLFHEMQPGDSIQLRSENSQDVNITCAADGRIEIVVQGYRPNAAIVARLSDYPEMRSVTEMIEAERSLLNSELSQPESAYIK